MGLAVETESTKGALYLQRQRPGNVDGLFVQQIHQNASVTETRASPEPSLRSEAVTWPVSGALAGGERTSHHIPKQQPVPGEGEGSSSLCRSDH